MYGSPCLSARRRPGTFAGSVLLSSSRSGRAVDLRRVTVSLMVENRSCGGDSPSWQPP